MQKFGLKLNCKDRFALAEKFCYFGYAPVKSGVGIRTPISNRDFPSYFVMVDRLRRSMRSAVFTLSSGSTNLGRSASISLVPNVGGKENLERGTTMKLRGVHHCATFVVKFLIRFVARSLRKERYFDE